MPGRLFNICYEWVKYEGDFTNQPYIAARWNTDDTDWTDLHRFFRLKDIKTIRENSFWHMSLWIYIVFSASQK